MFCTQCGQSMDDKANFCPNCGAGVANSAPRPAGQPIVEKRLLRPRYDKWIGGVCGAFANYFTVDLALVRLLWAISVVLAGTGALAYVICWIIIPREPEPAATRPPIYSA